ncbi:MAG TPA: nucleotide disphospho-sugar-binding domain-containing protein [Clostridia bacterium]|nr:nucleotide disphospho-sugar-binding domain-containing protein [Clostridia bacterium]
MSNIIITTHWTDGDVIPFIRIGEMLKKRGHKVTLLTHCYYRKLARDAGLEFTSWDTEEQYKNMMHDMSSYSDTVAGLEEIRAFREKYEGINVRLSEFEKIQQHCSEKDTVILAKNRSSVAALMASEKFNIPIILFFMNPYEIGSMINFHSLNKDQLKDEANILRSCVGLPQIHSWLSWQSSPKVQLALWPEWFLKEMPEWPHPVRTVGFPLKIPKSHSLRMIPGEISAILEKDPTPVLITGGTSRQIKSDFYTTAIEACRILGKKTIVVTRFRELLPERLPSNVSWFQHVPLDTILPHMGAVINHGGIGTVSGAVYAAAPQLALACYVDRPLNASRIKSLGIGEYLPPSYWDPALIAEEIKKLLKPEYKQKCMRFAEELPKDEALAEVCKTAESISGNELYSISHKEILDNVFSANNYHLIDGTTGADKNRKKSKLQNLSPEVREFILRKKLETNKD